MRTPQKTVWLLGGCSLAVLGLVVVLALPRLRESSYLRQLDIKGSYGWRDAARKLADLGSVRAVPGLLRRSGSYGLLFWHKRMSFLGVWESDIADDCLNRILDERRSAAVGELVSLLRDPDASMRSDAAAWLCGAAFLVLPYLNEIRKSLNDEDAAVMLNAAHVLWELGEEKGQLEEVLKRFVQVDGLDETDQGYYWKTKALRLLRVLSAAPQIGTACCKGGKAPQDRTVAMAASTLRELLPLCSDSDLYARVEAIRAVGHALRDGGRHIAGKEGAEQTHLNGQAAKQDISLMKAALVVLLDALANGQTRARCAAAESIREIGVQTAAVGRGLLEATEDNESKVETLAVKALFVLGCRNQEVVSRFRSIVKSWNVDARAWACVALLQWDEVELDEVTPLLSKSLREGSASAAEAIGKLGSAAKLFTADLVVAATRIEPQAVRGYPWAPLGYELRSNAAVRALRAVVPNRKDLLPLILVLGWNPWRNISIEEWYSAFLTIVGLGKFSAPIAKDLMALLRHKRACTRAAAALCLAAIGAPKANAAIPILKSLYYTDERRVRYWVARALRVLVGRQFIREGGPVH